MTKPIYYRKVKMICFLSVYLDLIVFFFLTRPCFLHKAIFIYLKRTILSSMYLKCSSFDMIICDQLFEIPLFSSSPFFFSCPNLR